MFCEKDEKKSKCPKKNFQSVKRGWREEKKNYKCGISGVRKKRIGRKISEERKKIKVFFGKKRLRFSLQLNKVKVGEKYSGR